MAIPILIIGKSGSGKSYSLRNIPTSNYALINIMGKRLPFRGNKPFLRTFNYGEIKESLLKYSAKTKLVVIDDAGYLLTDSLMNVPVGKVQGNAIFSHYREMAENFYELINFITLRLPDDMIVPIIMHEEIDDFGFVKPKTVGKMLDEKVDIPGMMTIVIRAIKGKDGHTFVVKTDGMTVVKTPAGMFEGTEIPNDMNLVVQTIREFYNLDNEGENENE